MTISPLHVGHEGWNWAADGGTRFDWLSTAKNPKLRETRKAGLRAPQAWSDGAEAKEQGGKDGKTS